MNPIANTAVFAALVADTDKSEQIRTATKALLVTFVCFAYSSKILALIGEIGLSIVTRLMGLILAVIGTQMLVVGVSAAC
jgi:small neutral amino acid transporter SnatA (MarC family)